MNFLPALYLIYEALRPVLLATQIIINVIFLILLILHFRKKVLPKKANDELIFRPNQPTPPPDLSLLEIAELDNANGSVSSRARVAALIDLAVNKHITLIYRDKTWQVRINDPNISKEERGVLEFFLAMFMSSSRMEVGMTYPLKENGTNGKMDAYYEDVVKSLEAKGLFEAGEDKVVHSKSGRAVAWWHSSPAQSAYMKLVLAPFFINILFAAVILGLEPVVVYLVWFVIMCIATTLFNKFGRQTDYGLQVRAYISGFTDYLKSVEAPRILAEEGANVLQPNAAGEFTFKSELLPYIILFGIDTTWLNKLNHFAANPDPD